MIKWETHGKTLYVVSLTKDGDRSIRELTIELKPGETAAERLQKLCPEVDFVGPMGSTAECSGSGDPKPEGSEPAREQPSDATFADLNGDGRPDIIVCFRGSSNLSVRFALQGGGLSEPVVYPCGPSPLAVLAGDFNGDGHLDLVTANAGNTPSGPGSLSLLLNQGGGTFLPAQTLAVPGSESVERVAAGDFDGDGRLDLAYTAYRDGEDQVVVRLGSGGGAFHGETVVGAGRALAVANLNPLTDGHPDIVADGAVLFGNGDGTFADPAPFAEGVVVTMVAVGDLDGDGFPDLAAANRDNTLLVRLGNGDGSFQAPAYHAIGAAPETIVFGDLDGDGLADLFVSHAPGTARPDLFFNKGGGSLDGVAVFPAVANLQNRLWADDLAVAEVTGDGIPDLLVANGALAPAVLAGLGDGRFGPPQPISGLFGERVVTGDWNGDGFADLAILGGDGWPQPRIFVALGDGLGGFGAPATHLLTGPGGDSRRGSLIAADFDGDGKTDLAVTNHSPGTVTVLLGDGDGGFVAQPPATAGIGPRHLVAADFDGDGILDLAVACAGDFGELNGSVVLLAGLGDGTFAAAVPIRENVSPDSFAAADFDGDGNLDLALSLEAPLFNWDVEILLGDGEGGFAEPRPLGLQEDLIGHICAFDADQDGKPDLAFVAGGDGALLLRGLGDGTFVRAGRRPMGGGRIYSADLDLDGRPDLLAASGAGYVSALANELQPEDLVPKLEIRREDGQTVLGWPVVFSDWRLAESPNLKPPWTPSERPATISGSQWRVTLDPAAAPMFFRLEKP